MVGTVPRATLCPLGTVSIFPAQDWGLCVVQEQLEPCFYDLGREVSLSQPTCLPQPGLGQEPQPWAMHVTWITRTLWLHGANPDPRNPRGVLRLMLAGQYPPASVSLHARVWSGDAGCEDVKKGLLLQLPVPPQMGPTPTSFGP